MTLNNTNEDVVKSDGVNIINIDYIMETKNPSNKFRAWDTVCKKMYNTFEFVTSGGTLSDWIIWGETLKEMWNNYETQNAYPSLRFVLMQSTGFKDINDKEIYNGDILSKTRQNESYSGLNDSFSKLIVKWDVMGHWSFYNPALNSSNTIYNIPDLINYQVIGNVYETPELINNESN